ncbi:hypothetical protein D3C81_203120 [compost metagenome]
MAEQGSLKHVVGDGGAVDRDKGLRGTWRLLVNVACQHFLASAGLAGDQHGRLAARHTGGQFKQLPAGRFAGHGALITFQTPGSMPLHQTKQRLGLERLDQVVGSALAHRLDRPLDGGVRRHQQHRQLRLLPAQLAKQLVAVHARHVHIADHQAEGLFQYRLQRFFGTADGLVGKTADFQGIAQRLAQYAIILDQQYLDCHYTPSANCPSIKGSSTRTQVPRPAFERRLIVP